MPDEDVTLKDVLNMLRESQEEATEIATSRSEALWETLTGEQRLDAFCAVVRRLRRGTLEERRSYRGVLYDVFGFGTEAYGQAYDAGFLQLHNAVYDREKLEGLVLSWAKDREIAPSAVSDLLSALDTI